MTLLSVFALETQTSCCYWGCSMLSSFFFVVLTLLSHQIYVRFSSLWNERDDWNFNALRRMVSIRGRLL